VTGSTKSHTRQRRSAVTRMVTRFPLMLERTGNGYTRPALPASAAVSARVPSRSRDRRNPRPSVLNR
jgi:hypothetical protein